MEEKKRKARKTKKFTVMIIPEAYSDVKRMEIPRWLVYGLAGFVIVSVTAFTYFALTYGAYRFAKAENEQLKEINYSQALDLADLERETLKILNKLEDISQMDVKIRQMVGIDEKQENTIASRSQGGAGIPAGKISIFSGPSNLGPVQQESIDSWQISDYGEPSIEKIKKRLERIDLLTGVQENVLAELENDVSARLKYLEALPNNWPIKGRITADFAWRKNPFNSKQMEFHEGIDIAAAYGSAVKAAGAGKVTFSGWKPVYGYTVVINHGYGYTSQYAHNSKLLAKVGQVVQTGDIIARVGSTGRSTGPHVDFRVSYQGKWIDPISILE